MKKKIFLFAAIGLLLVVGVAVLYLFNPSMNAFFPRCFFYSFTGLKCPGCGSQRAIHHLLHLDFAKAFSQNALVMFLIPYIVLGIYFSFGGGERFPHVEKILFGRSAAIVLFIIIVAYWVLRNVC